MNSKNNKIGTKDSFIRKSLVFCCCWPIACGVAASMNMWDACDAYGFACLHHQECWWTLCSPICLSSKCGDTKKASEKCTLCIHFLI